MKTLLLSLTFVLTLVAVTRPGHAQPYGGACWWDGRGWVCPDRGLSHGGRWPRGRDWQWHRDEDWRRHRHEWRDERWHERREPRW